MKTKIDLLKQLGQLKGVLLPDTYISFERNIDAIIKKEERYTNDQIDKLLEDIIDKLLEEVQERITQDNALNDRIDNLSNGVKDISYDKDNKTLTIYYIDDNKEDKEIIIEIDGSNLEWGEF